MAKKRVLKLWHSSFWFCRRGVSFEGLSDVAWLFRFLFGKKETSVGFRNTALTRDGRDWDSRSLRSAQLSGADDFLFLFCSNLILVRWDFLRSVQRLLRLPERNNSKWCLNNFMSFWHRLSEKNLVWWDFLCSVQRLSRLLEQNDSMML